MHGHLPRKRFGQHFLHDTYVLDRIVAAIAPRRGDTVVEIGPGEGVLTRRLLDHLDRLDAIEIDRDLAGYLRAEVAPERLTVHCADALRFDFAIFPDGMRVVGNLPYNISTPLLFHLADCAERVRDMHFMLQREVVERMVAQPSTREYGRLSVMLQTRFRMEKLFRVAPGAFRPPPKVESAVVRLVPLSVDERHGVNEDVLSRVVTKAFSSRRKTLRNALRLAEEDYAVLGIDPGARPENLSPADYVRVAQQVMKTAPREG